MKPIYIFLLLIGVAIVFYFLGSSYESQKDKKLWCMLFTKFKNIYIKSGYPQDTPEAKELESYVNRYCK